MVRYIDQHQAVFLETQVFSLHLHLAKEFSSSDVKKIFLGAEEMAQCLRSLTTLPKHLGSIPSTQVGAHNCL